MELFLFLFMLGFIAILILDNRQYIAETHHEDDDEPA